MGARMQEAVSPTLPLSATRIATLSAAEAGAHHRASHDCHGLAIARTSPKPFLHNEVRLIVAIDAFARTSFAGALIRLPLQPARWTR